MPHRLHPKIEEQLVASSIEYRVRAHADLTVPVRSPRDFGVALGIDIERIAKTLLLKTRPDGTFVRVTCACSRSIELGVVAEHLGASRLSVASQAELFERLGQPPLGVSPFGAPQVPVIVDRALMGEPTIVVGGGVVGVEVEVQPRPLVDVTRATVLSVAKVRR